jgi:hypothetical protein
MSDSDYSASSASEVSEDDYVPSEDERWAQSASRNQHGWGALET